MAIRLYYFNKVHKVKEIREYKGRKAFRPHFFYYDLINSENCGVEKTSLETIIDLHGKTKIEYVKYSIFEKRSQQSMIDSM